MRWRASGTYSLFGNRRISSWNVENERSVSFGGRSDRSTRSSRLDDVRRLVEIDEPAHVEAVVDPLVRRVLALEFLGGVDGRLRLLAAVIEIDEIELRLARLRAERIARLQGAEVLDRCPAKFEASMAS